VGRGVKYFVMTGSKPWSKKRDDGVRKCVL